MNHPKWLLQGQMRLFSRLPELYVVIAFVLTLFLALLTPPFFVPDETAHSLRAMQVAHGVFVAHRSQAGVGENEDSGFAQVSGVSEKILVERLGNHGKPVMSLIGRDDELDIVRSVRWTGTSTFMRFPNTAGYPPTFYMPQAAGWFVARSAGLTIDHSLILSRLFAAWVCIAIGWTALTLCGFNRILLFVYLLFPGVLSLVASCSQDGLLLSSAGLFTAILSLPLASQRHFRPAELLVAALLIACCATARPPYLLFSPLLLLPVLESKSFQKRALLSAIGGVILVAALLLAWQHTVRPLGLSLAADANPAQQTAYIRAHFLKALATVTLSTVRFTKTAINGLYLIGADDVSFPMSLKVLSSVGLLGLLLAGRDYSLSLLRSKVAVVLSLAGIVLAVSAAEYIIWTAPGAGIAGGLQPRYELPLVPVIFYFGVWIYPRWPKLRLTIWPSIALLLVLVPSLVTPWFAAHQMHGTGLISALQHAF